jgi:hypothetical protein
MSFNCNKETKIKYKNYLIEYEYEYEYFPRHANSFFAKKKFEL